MSLELEPATTVIIVLDKINDAGAALIDAAQAARTPVIVVRPYAEPGIAGRPRRSFPARDRLRTETWGGTFRRYEPRAGEPLVAAHRDSAFFETRLDTLLRTYGTRTLVVIGVPTNLAVETTAREGYQRDYHVMVVSDCSAAASEAEHRVGLRNVARGSGTVTTSVALIDTLAGAAVS